MLSPRRALLAFVSFVFFVAAAPVAQAAPGDIDTSFGSGGEARLFPTKQKVALIAVAAQADDKVVLAGFDENGDLLVVRLLDNGEVDPSFGAAGKATLEAPGGNSAADAVAVQPDGGIVVAGYAQTGPGTSDFLVARFTPTGKPDPSFGSGDGYTTIKIGEEHNEAEALTIGAGGRLAVTGRVSRNKGADQELGVAVLRADGSPETEFGGDGAIGFESSEKHDGGVALAIRPDNRVLVLDSCGSGLGPGFVLVQFSSAGLPDPLFGGGDGVTVDKVAGTEGGLGEDLALLPDGKALVAGNAYDAVPPPVEDDAGFAAARYLPDGQIDPTFGEAGYFRRQTPGQGGARRVDVSTGGLLLSGAYEAPGELTAPALMRISSQGALDTAFGAGGTVLRPAAPIGEYLGDAGLDSQERLLTVSTAYVGGGVTSNDVARYLGNPRAVPISAAAMNHSPHARIKKLAKRIPETGLTGFSGTAGDPDPGDSVLSVEVGLLKQPRGAKKSAKGKKRPKVRWTKASGTSKWKLTLKKRLKRGRYVVFARAVDSDGLVESSFSKKLGNRYAFTIYRSPR